MMRKTLLVHFYRTLLAVLLAWAWTPATATSYIKDVQLVGGSNGLTIGSMMINYCLHQGWVKIDKNLNNGAGGDYIYLLYKADGNDDSFNYDCITDFIFADTYYESLVYEGRTYYPVSYDGDNGFKESKGNLNNGTGSSTKIFLYYTRDTFPDKRVVTGISFSFRPIGAVCWNTGSPCNLNTGNDLSAILFMHLETTQAQEPVKIGNGTTGSSRFPLNMNNSYSLAQQLYTAQEIGTAGTITALAFDHRHTQPFNKEHVQIYLKQTVDNPLSGSKTDIVKNNEYTLVYDGALSASGKGWVYIRLDTPYEYNGNQNLIVCCYDYGSSSVTADHTFSVHTASGLTQSYGSASSISLEEEHATNFTESRNNIQICIVPNSHRSPINLAVTGFTDETASISWSDPVGTHPTINHYEWQYKQAADENWSALSSTTSKSASLTGLSAFTDYLFRVKIVYNDGESSYSILHFVTAIDLPYTCGFENGMPGWSQVDHNHYYNVDLTGISEEARHDGNYGYMFRCYDTDPIPQYLISPGLPENTQIAVSFYYRNFANSSPETFRVGYSQTTSDVSAFTWVDEITAEGTDWHQYQHNFPAGTQYVAVQYESNKYRLYLDDFEFVANSPYEKPTGLFASELEETSVTLQWTAPANATGYAYQYRPLNGDWSSEVEINGTSVTLNSLTGNTTYDFRVKARFYTNASNYVAIRFMTEGPMVTIPHYQDFENGMEGWRLEQGHGRSGITTDQHHDGSYGFEFDEGSPEAQFLRSPLLDGNAAKVISFYYKNYAVQEGSTLTSYASSFRAGWSTKTNSLNDFKFTSEVEAVNGQWNHYSLQVPEGVKYVLIMVKDLTAWLYVDDISITEVPRPVATLATVREETQYIASFYDGSRNWQLPQGGLAYTVEKEGDDYVFYCIGDVIPSGTPVIILLDKQPGDTGSTKAIALSLSGTRPTPRPYNILQGSDGPVDVSQFGGKTVYVLGIDNNKKWGFYPFSGNTIPAGKAYFVAE